MRATRASAGTALLLALLLGSGAGRAQSLGELARQAQQRKGESTRKVWTNDDLGAAFPEVRLLRQPRQHPPSLGPYITTPMPKVRLILETARVRPGEMVFDIGSGDGRIVMVAAEEFGAQAVGIEIDPALVAQSRREVAARGLSERVKIIQANALDVDLSPADVVTLYLTLEGIELIRPHLERTLRPGTRVVSYVAKIPGWTLDPASPGPDEEVWLYRVP